MIVVVLRFDGSLRRGPGFPTLTSRMATCGSCIGVSPHDSVESARESATFLPLAVGSCFLPIPVDMSSAHSEYEGLLLGLNWLCEQTPSRLFEQNEDANSSSGSNNILLIQGDCKTVVDQLSGDSLSRKLQVLHRQALERIDHLQGIFDTIEFQHIPRSENSICDNLCSNLLNAVASTSWKNCLIELEAIRGSTRDGPTERGSAGTKRKGVSKNNSLLLDILTHYLGSESSKIKDSLRPPLYSKFAKTAEEVGDYSTLIQVGELLESESRWHSHPSSLKGLGVLHQINGWKGVGKERKAVSLERKHRFLLNSGVSMKATMSHEALESLKTIPVAWDESVPKNWSPLLDEWWGKTKEKTSWDEGTSVWVDSQTFRS